MNTYKHTFRRILLYAIPGNLVLAVLLIAGSAAADLNVGPGETYTVTGIDTVGTLNVEGTLIVESSGSLTFTSRSEIHGSDPAGHIIVNGGSIVGHARFDTDKTAAITMNSGSFRINGSLKFPDNPPGPVYMYLNGGILSAQDIHTMPNRNPHFIVGDGILRLDGNVEGRGQGYDPREWINLGIMVPAQGYEEIIVEYVAQGNYTEVRAVSSITEIQFASSTSEGSEEFSQVNIPVSLSEPVGMTVTVNYAVTGGTANSDDDYTLTTGTLTFDPGQSTPETITLIVVNDGMPEPDETVVITLSNPVNSQLGNNYQLTYTIRDSSPAISFVSSSSQAAETDSPVNITVMSAQFEEVVTVNYAVVGGSAEGGGIDYILDSGVLQFNPLVETQSISIALIDDGLEEIPDETIVIALSNPSSNAKLGSFISHTLTILPGITDPCPKGDLNGDCRTNVLDLQILGGQWLDEQGICSGADPGCANLDGVMGVNMYDFVMLSGNWLEAGTTVVINEVMASNGSTISDPQEPDEQPDWFEIYNPGVDTVDLGGMYFTDDNDRPTKWRIPSGISIPPGGFELFWADGDDDQGDYHTNFRFDIDGDNISLYASDGMTLIDTIDFRGYSQTTDISYGRVSNDSGNLRYLSIPTPGYANSEAYIGAVADTKFNHDRGFYDAAFDLVITSDTPSATIKYTDDGTQPSRIHGSTYTGPISIGSTTCIRAMAYKDGWLSTNVDTHTYIFGASDEQKAIPTLSMAGISGSRGDEDGTPISLELIYPEEMLDARQTDWKGFQSDCETADHSAYSYRLRWKTELGDSKLNYPFFEAAPVAAEKTTDQFDRIVLRCGKNSATTYLGDPWVQVSEKEMTGFGCNSMFMHLYQNGNYVGIVNPKERPDAWMWSSYNGGDFEDYFVLNHTFEPHRGNSILSGNRSRFDQMMDMGGLDDYNNYQSFMSLCDVSHFADYTILYWYSGFGDGCDNNYYGGMRTDPVKGEVPPEGFKMMMWDGEFCFTNGGGPTGNEGPWVPGYYDSTGTVIPNIWNKLRISDEFMMLFADRIYEHLYNDGALTDANSWGRWSTLAADVITAGASPGSVNSNMQGFANIFINAVRLASYYPNIDPPEFQHGGQVPVGFNLTMTNPNGSGTIYYTLDGTDPRAVGGGTVGRPYAGPISMIKSTRVKARANSGNWSALHEAVFGVGPVRENLRITEIMYHPADPTQAEKNTAGDQTLIDEDFEYIELKNIGVSAINLNLIQFTDGIDFTFGDFSLDAGQFAVIVKNSNAFLARYRSVSPERIAGTYTGALSNGGEEIVMCDAISVEIHNFNYRDSWFVVTDGDGYSLNKLAPDTSSTTRPNSWNNQTGWQPSSPLNGTPGVDE